MECGIDSIQTGDEIGFRLNWIMLGWFGLVDEDDGCHFGCILLKGWEIRFKRFCVVVYSSVRKE